MSDELDNLGSAPSGTFSPKLRQAMQEMLAIARKHDIGAYLLLTSERHAEERTRFPTWSVVGVESHEGRAALRIRSKGRKKEEISYTLNTIDCFARQPAAMSLNMFDVLETLQKHWDFKTNTWKGPEAPPWDFR